MRGVSKILVLAIILSLFVNGGRTGLIRAQETLPFTGAIFTTTVDGSVVNKNVGYGAKEEVYLDGGPGSKAPSQAAGLPQGDYYFQVTDPSGEDLLSSDHISCRKIHVNEHGVIDQVYSGTNYVEQAGGWVPVSCQHNQGVDRDHEQLGAITVQLFPYDDTPNRGDEYKVWVTPAGAYRGDPGFVPQAIYDPVNGEEGPPGTVHGFTPEMSKTDNFKVRRQGPPLEPATISVHKFHDRNMNGTQEPGEEDLVGWRFELYAWFEGSLHQVAEGVTLSDGTLRFEGLAAGRYKLWEQLPECWEATAPSGERWNDGYYAVVDLEEGQQRNVDFGNVNVCPPPPPPTLCIDLEKTGPETALPGQTITYHYRVENCGEVDLDVGVQVYDPFFGQEPIWSGDLDSGQAHEFDKSYTVPDEHCGDLTNHAWAIGYAHGYAQVRDDADWTVFVQCEPKPAPSIDVEKYVRVGEGTWADADSPPGPEVLVGYDVWFRFVVSNVGDATLTGVALSDSELAVNTCQVPDQLAVGESFECVIGPVSAEQGQHTNTALASGEHMGATYSDTDDANYFGLVATQLALEPDIVTNTLPIDLAHSFTATVSDQLDQPLSGVLVSFRTDFAFFEGPITPTRDPSQTSEAPQATDDQYLEVVTDDAGQAVVRLSSAAPGTAHLWAWIDADGDKAYTQGEVTDDPSIKVWVVATPATLTLEPVDKTVKAGDSVAYQAIVEDPFGNTWDVTDDATLSIEAGAGGSWAGNVYVSQNIGTWRVTATYGDLSATATLHVVSNGDALVYKIYLPIVSPSFWTATIVLEPKADAVLPVGTPRTFTATLLDSAKMPWVGRRVSFSTDLGTFQGGSQYAELFTNSLGQATVTVVSTLPGTAHVRVWLDGNDNDIFDEGEATDVPSTVTWIE